MDSTNQKELAAYARTRFPCLPAVVRNGELIKMQHSCDRIDIIRHPNSSYVTTKLYGTSTCGCNNNTIFSERTFHVSYRRCMPAALARQRRSLGDSCQSGKMAALFNSLFVVFKISFLPKYHVKYYDYIVKWCSGI